MSISGRVSVEHSELESPKRPLPAVNSDMSSRSPQLSSEGSEKGCDVWLNTPGACGGLAEQSTLPYPPQQVLGSSLTLSISRGHYQYCNRSPLSRPPVPHTAPPLVAASLNNRSTSGPSSRVLISDHSVT